MPTPASPDQADCNYRDPEPFTVEAHGAELTFMPAGKDRLECVLDTIKGAQASLKLFYYMFQDDEAGTQVRDALVKAVERGVDVRLLVDRFGTDAPNAFFQPIVDGGGSFAVFSPKWSRRYFIRNHQKILIADEEVAVVGGFNISDHYFAPPVDNGWCDMGVRMTGPGVDQLLAWYRELRKWTENPTAQYRAIRQTMKHWDPGDGPIRLTLGGPIASRTNWARTVKRDMAKASRLDMVMAYFSPPLSYRRVMRKLARRGDVRLIMAGKSDNPATIGAARAQYGSFLRAGAQIHEFEPCKLHMKLAVVDDIVYFGSGNFDHRSVRINLELMFRIQHEGLAQRMREFIDGLERASTHVTPELHRKRSGLWTQIKWRVGWFLVSTLDYTVSRSLNAGL